MTVLCCYYLCQNPTDDIDTLDHCYKDTFSAILSQHAPPHFCVITVGNCTWFSLVFSLSRMYFARPNSWSTPFDMRIPSQLCTQLVSVISLNNVTLLLDVGVNLLGIKSWNLGVALTFVVFPAVKFAEILWKCLLVNTIFWQNFIRGFLFFLIKNMKLLDF